jgi:hypothetical protein
MRLPVLIVLVCSTVAFAADERDTAATRMAKLLKEEFTFQPPEEPAPETVEAIDPSTDVVVLPLFRTFALPRGAVEAIEAGRIRAEKEKFSWKHGGTILKLRPNVELKFKYNPEHNGIDLLNFSW